MSEKTKLAKKDCLIVEDSEKGITAAIKSGAHVLEVKNPLDVTKAKILQKIKEVENAK